MLKINKNMNNKKIMKWIAAIIIVFAVTSPVTGAIASMLLVSQSYSTLNMMFIGALIGSIITFYGPIVYDGYKLILEILMH